ncbi:DUF3102 domain-containing protein [Clostridium sp. KNHs216]|uniref:DUF3102 domain-containing protein n=1 Tax=Clostridium sp. KNHs216 TaxID=1550235 RepID=UPI00114E8FBB|nr:DUF3102 domain-containing protein [Clostridium sp. KNHs216]TQI66749.1 Protein of unknown function (DUF3102) [Clostridium sp. KNHs216]
MKQKYICKCGKTFEKDTTADTTGYRLGADFGPDHECYGCHFVVPIEEGYPKVKIVDYECRASRKINYRTTSDIPRTRDSFHVAHVNTLDITFAREIWEFSRALDGLDDSHKEMDLRGVLYRSDGRYDLGLYFTKTKAGIASCVAISDKFFAGGSDRPGMTVEQERTIVLQQIETSKKKAKDPVRISASGSGPVSNGAQNQRSIDQITLEINFYKAQTAQNIIEIGKRLIEAKQQLQHGEWLPWLRDKVEFSVNSADNFMKIAREYSNSQPVVNLSYTKLLALLQVPEDEREEFLQETHLVDGQEKTVSEMSKRELQEAIKQRDEAQQRERQAQEKCWKAEKEAAQARKEKKTEYNNYMDALVKAEKANETIKALRGSRQFDLQRITDLETQIKELESRPIDVAVQELSEDDKKKLRGEGYEDAARSYKILLDRAREELEQAKNQARQDAGIEQDELVAAAESFRDSLDSNFDNFQLILRLSPSQAIGAVMPPCIRHLKELVSDLEDTANMAQNISLADEEFELPPEDGFEE